jgi:hypothetical protein
VLAAPIIAHTDMFTPFYGKIFFRFLQEKLCEQLAPHLANSVEFCLFILLERKEKEIFIFHGGSQVEI